MWSHLGKHSLAIALTKFNMNSLQVDIFVTQTKGPATMQVRTQKSKYISAWTRPAEPLCSISILRKKFADMRMDVQTVPSDAVASMIQPLISSDGHAVRLRQKANSLQAHHRMGSDDWCWWWWVGSWWEVAPSAIKAAFDLKRRSKISAYS